MSKTIMLIDSSERDIVIEAFRRGACGVIFPDELFGNIVRMYPGRAPRTNLVRAKNYISLLTP